MQVALTCVTIKIKDMHCRACEEILERQVENLPGVYSVKADFRKNTLQVNFDQTLCAAANIDRVIKQAGYTVGEPGGRQSKALGAALIAAAIILLGNYTGGIDMDTMLQQQVSYFMLFVIGLLTSLHCIGMCGGIMVSQTIANDNGKVEFWQPALLYNTGRLLSYTLVGGIVGALGSVIAVSLSFKAGITIFAGCFMILMGLNLLGFGIPLPLPGKIRALVTVRVSRKGPFAIGLLNGLLPCGPLQTMQVFALGSGSAMAGATAMLLFGLGTMPLMLPLGWATGWLSRHYVGKILKFSGAMVIVLGLIMANRGLAIAGINWPVTGVFKTQTAAQGEPIKAEIKDGIQFVRIAANDKGYVPNVIVVQKNVPVKWIIDGQQINSCNNEIIVPSLQLQKKLRQGETIIEFTPGDNDIRFSCWMGMIQGLIKVVDNLETADISKVEPLPAAGGCCGGGACGMGGNTRPSIYGEDVSTVATDRLVKKATVAGGTQTASIKGSGYEFDPLVIVMAKGKLAKLTFDLEDFDSPEGKFEIIEGATSNTLVSFPGRKGSVAVQFAPRQAGSYGIVKEGKLYGVVEVVDDLAGVSLEQVRNKLL